MRLAWRYSGSICSAIITLSQQGAVFNENKDQESKSRGGACGTKIHNAPHTLQRWVGVRCSDVSEVIVQTRTSEGLLRTESNCVAHICNRYLPGPD